VPKLWKKGILQKEGLTGIFFVNSAKKQKYPCGAFFVSM
jgi:hypothetical protein